MLEINFGTFPVIETQRLILRLVTKADAPQVLILRSHPEVMKYLDRSVARNIDDAMELINKIEDAFTNNQGITWAITVKGSNDLVGTYGFWRIDKEHHRAEVGYSILPEYQGKGLMQEATKVVLDYGFRVLKFHTIEGNVNPNNIASIKLLEKNGFVKEAHFKENYYYNGRFIDSAIYSLITPYK